MNIDVGRSRLLTPVPHGFLGRAGGLSTGLYASLNVGIGSDDDEGAVLANRARARDALAPGAALVTVRQVHSATCVTVDGPLKDDARPQADAMVTRRPGLLLGILTADCAPILFADQQAGVIGAAHAGWKGALTGIVQATVDAMVALGARRDRINAAIGPCIAQRSYEVDEAFKARIEADDAGAERFFLNGARPGRHQFDLESYVAARAATAGLRSVECLSCDTYSQSERYFSYRRATHLQEADYGRQLSAIALIP